MWARKRIDIGYREMLKGLLYCVYPPGVDCSEARIHGAFSSASLVNCLSVRSGFELALQAFSFPADSQILFTGYTIPDMPRIASVNGLRPVGIDLEPNSLAPSLSRLEAAISAETRAIVVAHLMGGRCNIDPISEIARRYNLVLIEDCAQVYVGNGYTGHPQADVSMFSFGPIKTNTSLGGGVLMVRDLALLKKMRQLHRTWESQTALEFTKRIGKYGLLRWISSRPLANLLRLGFKTFGKSHDEFATRLAHSFHGSDFVRRIRKRPSAALLGLLADRLDGFDPATIDSRRSQGNKFKTMLQKVGLNPVGAEMLDQTYWVFAIAVDCPDELVPRLWEKGFDATSNSSLRPISIDEFSARIPIVERLHRHIVFLPLHVEMSQSDLERMVEVISRYTKQGASPTHLPANGNDENASVENKDLQKQY